MYWEGEICVCVTQRTGRCRRSTLRRESGVEGRCCSSSPQIKRLWPPTKSASQSSDVEAGEKTQLGPRDAAVMVASQDKLAKEALDLLL